MFNLAEKKKKKQKKKKEKNASYIPFMMFNVKQSIFLPISGYHRSAYFHTLKNEFFSFLKISKKFLKKGYVCFNKSSFY